MKVALAEYTTEGGLCLDIIELNSFTTEGIREWIKDHFEYTQKQVDRIEIEIVNDQCEINIDFDECGIQQDDYDYVDLNFKLIG